MENAKAPACLVGYSRSPIDTIDTIYRVHPKFVSVQNTRTSGKATTVASLGDHLSLAQELERPEADAKYSTIGSWNSSREPGADVITQDAKNSTFGSWNSSLFRVGSDGQSNDAEPKAVKKGWKRARPIPATISGRAALSASSGGRCRIASQFFSVRYRFIFDQMKIKSGRTEYW